MTTTPPLDPPPPPPPPHAPPPATPPTGSPGAASQPRRRRWVIPLVVGGVALLACCVGIAAIALNSGDDESGPVEAAADDRSSTDADPAPDQTADGDGEPADPEPADAEPAGFGPGIWEVGDEIPSGTYVTTVPDGGILDSCYWARLSGFSGDFDELIANDNLDAGARGRVTISDSDAGVEFTGDCRWVEVSEAEPVTVGDQVGAGVWAVGDELQPGTYTTEVPGSGVLDSCYWARLSGFSGEFHHLIANDNLDAGARGRVEISPSDAGIEFRGDCTWTRQ